MARVPTRRLAWGGAFLTLLIYGYFCWRAFAG